MRGKKPGVDVAFFEIQGWEKPLLRRALKGLRLAFHGEALTGQNAGKARWARMVSIFISSKITAGVLQKLPRLKMIATRSTGYDHIDLKACQRGGVSVCNVPTYGENTVAEHTFALILALSRNVHKSYVRGLRNDYSIEGLKGFDLQDKTLGVVGAGHIGLHVARIAKGFGMKVLAADARQDRFLADVLGFRYAPLAELLASSDIVTLHVPLLPGTRHLINRKTLSQFKKGALLINTSRGEIVDTQALLEALDEGRLGGAGLDVLEGEQLIKEEKQLLHEPKRRAAWGELARDHALLSKDNVVFTPHIAFYSQEALERIVETTAKNISAFEEGKPQNLAAKA